MTFALGPDVLLQRVGSGAVLLQARTGQYYELNDSGADLLQFVLETQDVETALNRMQHTYAAARDDLAADLKVLFADLKEAGLLLFDAEQLNVEDQG